KASAAGEAAIKSIRHVLDDGAFVPAEVVSLAQWTAEYYAAGVGEAIMAVLPPMTRGDRSDAPKTKRVAAPTAARMSTPDGLTPKQRETLELLAAAPSGMATPDLAARGISAATIARLVGHGLVTLRHDRVERDPFAAGTAVVDQDGDSDRPPTPGQNAA